jgi:hypothetical protein
VLSIIFVLEREEVIADEGGNYIMRRFVIYFHQIYSSVG